ncbi:MAG: hypothetical protein ACFB21_16295 [Opitutales bacterium]
MNDFWQREDEGSSAHRLAWCVAIGAHVVMLAILIANPSLLSSRLTYNEEELREQLKAVEERSREREERERAEREKREILEEHQEPLRDEFERRERPDMVERVQDLERLRDEVRELAEQRLEATANRDPENSDSIPPELEVPETPREIPLAERDVPELYAHAETLEAEIAELYDAARAADLAEAEDMSLAEAATAVVPSTRLERPPLDAQLQQASFGTVAELSQYRELLGQAVAEADSMRAQAASRRDQLAGPGGRPALASGASGQGKTSSGRPGAGVAVTSAGPSGEQSQGGGELRITEALERNLRAEAVAAQALPGRRFTDEAERSGWLYIDTWYVIGPWPREPYRRGKPLPPEYEVNLDAVYLNGKQGTVQEARTHRRLDLDGELRWQFVQSDMLFVRPPKETRDAIYFAYTEVFSDRPREVLIAFGIDDWSEVRLNGEVIAQGDAGSWRLGQELETVTLQAGYNDFLLRMENGGELMDFSLVLIPSAGSSAN